jgi:hypothetical protein
MQRHAFSLQWTLLMLMQLHAAAQFVLQSAGLECCYLLIRTPPTHFKSLGLRLA